MPAHVGGRVTTRSRPPKTLPPAADPDGAWSKACVDSAPQAVIATDADGLVQLWNPAAERLYGWRADEVIGRDVVEVLAPDDLLGEARSILAGLRAGESWTGMFTVRHKDGTTLQAVVSNRPVLDTDGTTTGIIGESRVLTDPVDKGIRGAADVAIEVASRLAGLQAVTIALARAVDRAEVADAVFLHGLRDLGGHTGSLCLVEPGGTTVAIVHEMGYSEEVKASWHTFPLDAALPASEAIRTGELVLIRSRGDLQARFPIASGVPLVGDHAYAVVPLADEDGTVFGALVVGFADPRDFDDQDVALLRALGAQCAGALRRAELFEETRAAVAAEQAARRAAEDAHEGLAFLAEASSALGSSLDYERTLARLVDLAVPRLADWCAVFVGDHGGGPIRLLTVAHADPDRVSHVRRLLDRYPPDPDAQSSVGAVIRTGRTELTREIDDAVLERAIADPERRALVRELGLGSTAILPLQAGGRVLGALVLATDRGRPLPDRSLTLGVDLAVRAGVAIDNAMLFAERTRIARQLQASLLPARLPVIPGLDIGARYAAAGLSEEVGGDFYDVFALDRGRWAVVVGDVRGKGVEAAAVTGLTRHTIRSASLHMDSPRALLSHLNEVLVRTEEERPPVESDDPTEAWAGAEPRFCTVGVAVLEPTSHGARVTVCVAGHPLPLVARAGGVVETVGRAGSLLGVDRDVDLYDVTAELGPGEALVTFTDGIVERHEGRRFFEAEGVAAVLRATRGMSADEMAAAIEDAARGFVAGDPRDDMAVVVVRVARCGDGDGDDDGDGDGA